MKCDTLWYLYKRLYIDLYLLQQSMLPTMQSENEPSVADEMELEEVSVQHVTLGAPLGGEDLTEVFDALSSAMESVNEFKESDSVEAKILSGQKVDLWAPTPFDSNVRIFIDCNTPLKLGNTMVKLNTDQSRVLSSTIPFYYFEFTQALVRIIAFYSLYIIALLIYSMATYDPDAKDSKQNEMEPEHYQLFFGQMLHSLGAYILVALGSGCFLQSATRLGRMGALNELSSVQGFHFMLLYSGKRSAEFCGSLASALSMEGSPIIYYYTHLNPI